MEYIKWKTHIIIAFIDLFSVYLAHTLIFCIRSFNIIFLKMFASELYGCYVKLKLGVPRKNLILEKGSATRKRFRSTDIYNI